MANSSFQPQAYLKVGCPYSFKFLLFMAEAGLLDEIDVIRCDPDDPHFDDVKDKLARGLKKNKASFPTVEVEPGRYESDSDRLIDYFARRCGVARHDFAALEFYRESILPQLEKLHRIEND